MQGPDDSSTSQRERMFNAPALPLLIAALMPILFWFQERLADQGLSMAFRATDLWKGHWAGLFTSMLLHGGWAHLAMNAVGVAAFGSPVARLFNRGVGPGVFLTLYIVSGAVAALGFAACNPASSANLIGASGAVFGLIGAATRLMGGQGRVLPLLSKDVLKAAAGWIGVNLFIGLIGFAPGFGAANIAWEAHVFGFLFGIIMIGPLARLFAPGSMSSVPTRARP